MTALATAIDAIGDHSSANPETSEYRADWRSSAWMIALLAIVLSSVVSSLSYTATADRQMGRQFDAKAALYRDAAQRLGYAQEIKNQGIALAQEAAVDASLVDAIPRSRALAEVANAVAPGIRVVHLSLLPASESTAAASLLRIQGVAGSEGQLTEFISRLCKSRWLQGVDLISQSASPPGNSPGNSPAKSPAKARGGTGARNFEITAIFDHQADGAPSPGRSQ